MQATHQSFICKGHRQVVVDSTWVGRFTPYYVVAKGCKQGQAQGGVDADEAAE